MTSPPILPRSLEPLADESLFGFLLRLGHRLEQPPHFLAKAAGLTIGSGAASRIPTGLALRLGPEQVDRFARASQLDHDEVINLTMVSLGSRYPPADYIVGPGRHGPQLRQAQGLPSLRRWMSTHPARFCPECLAGHSAIETTHGGSWRKLWHLPVAFACPLHRRLLVATCPACGGRPAASSGLIASSVEILHPVQCRSPIPSTEPHPRHAPRVCGQRLDLPQPTQQASAITPILLPLQARLLALLDEQGPATTTSVGKQVPISHYMMDLRLVSVLVRASWPIAVSFIDSAQVLESLESYADSRLADLEDWGRQGRRVSFTALHDAPPVDPAVCGAVVAVAEAILNAAVADEMLRPMLADAARSAPWRTFLENAKRPCSSEFRTLVETVTEQVRPRRRPPRSAGSRGYNGWLEYHRVMGHTVVEPTGDCRFDHRHVPQNMTDEWFSEHFTKDPGINPRHLRRIAAIRLVQMSTGGSVEKASSLLGIPPSTTTSLPHTVAQWTQDRDNAITLNTAIRAFADSLNQHPDALTDYGKRRSFLAGWVIPLDDWAGFLTKVEEAGGLAPGRATATIWTERRRYVASVLAWQTVTQGDRGFAPLLKPGGQAHGDAKSIRQEIWHAFHPSTRGKINTGLATLVALIPGYAHQVASAIDRVKD